MFSIVIVTYNRSENLKKCLNSITKQEKCLLEKIYVVDNNSTDDTETVVKEIQKQFPTLIKYRCLEQNIGGSGGFAYGGKWAYQEGAHWIGFLDDDVILADDCLKVLSHYNMESDCLVAVREDIEGNLVEQATLRYNLDNPFILNPRCKSLSSIFKSRSELPQYCELEGASFEGFFFTRSIVERVGLPYPEYFIFGDDFDFSIRIQRAGYNIKAIRDAVIIRQLPYVRNVLANDWKFYYRWRNFFVLHFLYGKNFLVRFKPYPLAICLSVITLLKSLNVEPISILNDARKLAGVIRHNYQK